MANAAPSPCNYPGCHAITVDGRCERHRHKPWSRDKRQDRLRGRPLQRRRASYFAEHPLCAQCETEGAIRTAMILDHIIPLSEGGSDDPDNWQGLCRQCHDEKTKAESARGAYRRRKA